MKKRVTLILTMLLSVCTMYAQKQTATVSGVITDAELHDFLPGASVIVEGGTVGTIADANGNFTLTVPTGKQTLRFDFLGYVSQEIEIDLKRGETKSVKVVMKSDSQVLEGVIISVQAKGQAAAINSQIHSSAIINAVSGEKLSELPDVNVADAIGRLPGLMIQRDGGEGQKIVIRGLDPKYNTVAINGMNAPSTSTSDRSTDLNMISPDMIASAEVMKANTADKDADGLGGTVNLILKDAPEKFRVSLQGETGYHSQINNIGRAKGGLTISDRVANNRLGIIFSGSYDRTDRSNDTFGADYKVSGNAPTEGLDYTKPWLTTTSLQANLEKRSRYNANLNFDLKIGNGSKIKFSNIFSRLERDRDVRSKQYNVEGSRLRFRQTDSEGNTMNLSNVLQGDFNIGTSTLSVGAGHSSTWQKTPWSNEMTFNIEAPYLKDISELDIMAPYDAIAPENVNEDISQFYLYDTRFKNQKTYERELSANIDWKMPIEIGSNISGYIKAGFKYRQKYRENENKAYYRRFDLAGELEEAYQNMPDMTHSAYRDGSQIGIDDFLDTSYKDRGNFLKGYYPNCGFAFALNDDAMRNFYDHQQQMYYFLKSEKLKNDYSGTENMYAGYIMGEFNFGKYVTFIPGVRYDFTSMKYSAFSGSNVNDNETDEQQFNIEPSTDSGKFGYWLPQIHLKVMPTEWMDIRLAYTQTLSRPDYDKLAPRTIINPTKSTVDWSRTNLKPALSTNYDATISFYPNNWGLFSISGFYKDIDNFIYDRNAVILAGTATDADYFELSQAYNGYIANYPLNSPTKASIVGLELDAQLQLRSLHNWLSGFVFSANFTIMDSRMRYNTTHLGRIPNPEFGKELGAQPFIQENIDVAYEDRLLSQPSYLFNTSIGYDYKGFSARVSCNVTDGVLLKEQQRTDAADKEISKPFVKVDSQVKYTFNKWVSLYATWSNMNFALDRSVRYVTGYPKRTEYYGTTAYIGVKFNLIH